MYFGASVYASEKIPWCAACVVFAVATMDVDAAGTADASGYVML